MKIGWECFWRWRSGEYLDLRGTKYHEVGEWEAVLIVLVMKYFSCDQVKGLRDGHVVRLVHMRNARRIFAGNVRRRWALGIKTALKEQGERSWTGVARLRTWFRVVILSRPWRTFGLHEEKEMSCLSEKDSAPCQWTFCLSKDVPD